MEGGGEWALDMDNPRAYLGRRVTVEGLRSGFDRIDVEKIEWAPPQAPGEAAEP